jgi:hypothetical protein
MTGQPHVPVREEEGGASTGVAWARQGAGLAQRGKGREEREERSGLLRAKRRRGGVSL